MTRERRFYEFVPETHKNDLNELTSSLIEDPLFEPDQGRLEHGHIGNLSKIPSDIINTINEITTPVGRKSEQLSIAAALQDPITGNIINGTFKEDILNIISINGGITSDRTRLFDSSFYNYSIPMDYDKFINFSRYFWLGTGDAINNGEFIVKESITSVLKLHKVVNGSLTAINVTLGSVPITPIIGDLWEDNRTIKEYDGTSWKVLSFKAVDTLPIINLINGDYYFLMGHTTSKTIVHRYSGAAGRWVSLRAIISTTQPISPSYGMLWDKVDNITGVRNLQVYDGSAFNDITYNSGLPNGIGADGGYIYGTGLVDDGWSNKNEWVHIDDLSGSDRELLNSKHQASRPIIEFWGNIEPAQGDVKTTRNQFPIFTTYKTDAVGTLVKSSINSSIFQYETVTLGTKDAVLGFIATFESTGQLKFKLTLESDTITDDGYGSFLDTATGLAHSYWTKSKDTTKNHPTLTEASFTHNQKHQAITNASRSNMETHLRSNIGGQTNFIGNNNGLNNYRWSNKDQTASPVIVDMETNMFALSAGSSRSETDIFFNIRQAEQSYTNFMFKFINRINILFDNNSIADPTGTLKSSPSDILDVVLTDMLLGTDSNFPYWHSNMGVYTEREMINGVVTDISTSNGQKPIMIADSPVMIGSYPASLPFSVTNVDGSFLVGHDGTRIPSFGDSRDDIWLELQHRFYSVVIPEYKEESLNFSASRNTSNFILERYYGGLKPQFLAGNIIGVVSDINTVTNKVGKYIDSSVPSVFQYDGNKWVDIGILTDDVWFNVNDSTYWMYNGWKVIQINQYDNGYTFDYTTDEYHQIIREWFENWVISRNKDFVTNNIYNKSDPFTWNYASAGVAGHYQGIYKSLYNTPYPDIEPWKVIGYVDKPTWWDSVHTPNSIGKYPKNHNMWTSFKNETGRWKMVAPVPVDNMGNLLDPIKLGIVNTSDLNFNRINDTWKYRDGSPVEQEFYNSTEFSFAKTSAAILMKPSLSIDYLWSNLLMEIGSKGNIKYFNAPHIVHSSNKRRFDISSQVMHLEKDSKGSIVKQSGLSSWISENIAKSGKNVTKHFGDSFRNTFMVTAWKTFGFVNPVRTELWMMDGNKVPQEDLHHVMYRSQPIVELFLSGVNITHENNGYRIFGFDLNKPRFEIDEPAIDIFSGQTEIIETFNISKNVKTFAVTKFNIPNNNDTATFSVVINGLKIQPKYYKIERNTVTLSNLLNIGDGDSLNLVLLTTQGNIKTKTKQFIVGGVAFPYSDTSSNTIKTYDYGHFFENSTDVINFLMGYGRKLEQDGWTFDQKTPNGIGLNWLNASKAFAGWVLDVANGKVTTDFNYTPFQGKIVFNSKHGQAININEYRNGSSGLIHFDLTPVNPTDTIIKRIDNSISITTTDPLNKIYGAKLYIVEDQHVVFLSNVTKFNDLLYDSILSVGRDVYRIETYRTIDQWNGRIDTPGHITGSSNTIPAFEKQVSQINKLNDSFSPVDDPELRDIHRFNYGWYPMDSRQINDIEVPVMAAVNASDRQQLNFHRGMIHAKGTIGAMNAFARGLPSGINGVSVNEDWLWKLDTGGTRRIFEIELGLSKNMFTNGIGIFAFDKTLANENVTIVEDYNRDTQLPSIWTKPPHDTINGKYQIEFPFVNDIPDNKKDGAVYINDINENQIIINTFMFDPAVNWKYNDPVAISQLDIVSYIDMVDYNNNQSWTKDKVGKYWFDLTRYNHIDYRKSTLDIAAKVSQWGNLMYFRGGIVRVNDKVTVTTMDAVNGSIQPHNLKTNDTITISGADQSEYNISVTVTVESPETFSFLTDVLPASPATGNIIITTGFADVAQWTMSPVPPESYDLYAAASNNTDNIGGTPKDGVNTRFIQSNVMVNGVMTVRYFFWVVSSDHIPDGKQITTNQLQNRLSNPSDMGVAWYGLVNNKVIMINAGNNNINENNTLSISFNKNVQESIIDWVIVSENEKSVYYDTKIIEKIINSLTGVDTFGNSVPDIKLPLYDRMGNTELPIRSIFKIRADALNTFNDIVNSTLSKKLLNDIIDLNNINKISGLTWNKATYIQKTNTDRTLDTVASIAVRDSKHSKGFYVVGDIIKVENSGIDVWDKTKKVAEYFELLANNTFDNIGIDHGTFNITVDINTADLTIRDLMVFLKTKILTVAEFNNVLFAMLKESIHQNIFQNWLIKSSYVKISVKEPVLDQYNFVRPDYTKASVLAFEEIKPYHTKIRKELASYSHTKDAVTISMKETIITKPILVFDRLSCGLEQGWNTQAWNHSMWGWDTNVMDFVDFGKNRYMVADTTLFSNFINKQYTFTPHSYPDNYSFKFEIYFNGVKINPDTLGLTFSHIINGNKVILTLNVSIPADYEVRMLQNIGMTIGTPRFGFIHQGFRDFISGYGNCSVNNDGEHTNNKLDETVSIGVTTNWVSYSGSVEPLWDNTAWDKGTPNNGPRTFFIGIGNDSKAILPSVAYQTCETVTTNNNFATFGNQNPVNLKLNGVPLIKGVHYDITGSNNSSITLLDLPVTNIIANGINTTYSIPTSYINGIKEIRLDGQLLSSGVHYNISGNNINFVQSNPQSNIVYGTMRSDYFRGNGIQSQFTISSVKLVNPNNMMVFVNGKYQPHSKYSVFSKNVSFITAPSNNDNIVFYYIEDDLLSTSVLNEVSNIGDGVTLLFNVGISTGTEFVFINGILIDKTQYNKSINGVFTFITAPANSSTIDIVYFDVNRSLTSGYNTFATSGNNSDTIGLTTTSSNNLLIFESGLVKNPTGIVMDYTITNNNTNDHIQWNNVPAIGTNITAIWIASVELGSSVGIVAYPPNGSKVQLLPNTFYNSPTSIEACFKEFNIGNNGDFMITQKPSVDYTLDFKRKKLVLVSTTPSSEIIKIKYTRPTNIGNIGYISAKTQHPVDRITKDHTIWDNIATGYEINRKDGLLVLDTTTNTIYKWDVNNNTWISLPDVINVNDYIYVKNEAAIYKYTGTTYKLDYKSGYNNTHPIVIPYPSFGKGVTYGTLVYGTTTNNPAAQKIYSFI